MMSGVVCDGGDYVDDMFDDDGWMWFVCVCVPLVDVFDDDVDDMFDYGVVMLVRGVYVCVQLVDGLDYESIICLIMMVGMLGSWCNALLGACHVCFHAQLKRLVIIVAIRTAFSAR